MRRKKIHNYLLILFLSALAVALVTETIERDASRFRLTHSFLHNDAYRSQRYSDEMLAYLRTTQNPGRDAGLYLLDSNFGTEQFRHKYTQENFETIYKRWQKRREWSNYNAVNQAIWQDIQYFPIPEPKKGKKYLVTYENSWMNERTYGGRRGHEGTDLMMKIAKPGIYPVLSITAGVVTQKGWLEKGGWRIGITAPGGAYFYYAHLDSYANLKVGDNVVAGTILGFAGDSGYGSEGTRGQFPVHLHVGIYITDEDEEVSINPYYILRYLEDSKLRYSF